MRKVPAKRLLLLLLVVGFGVYGVYRFGHWLYYRYTHAVTEDAFVEADIVNLSPLVPGRIEKIYVDESQEIKKGQLLFKLDDRDYRARYELAKAQVEYAKSRLEVLKAKLLQAKTAYEITRKVAEENVKAAHHDLEQAKAKLDRVKKDYLRFKNLFLKKAVGKRKFDLVKEEYLRTLELVKIKRTRLDAAKAKLKEIKIKETQIVEIKKEIESAKRAVEKAVKSFEVAKVNLEHTKVYSPLDGVVAKKYLQEGDFAAAGYPVLAVYDASKVYVLANLEETRFDGVDVGDEVDIWVDAYPGRLFKGRVKRILPASAAKFALIPRDVTAGEFTKVVQRIPIKIAIEGDGGKWLIPGMSVEIGIKK